MKIAIGHEMQAILGGHATCDCAQSLPLGCHIHTATGESMATDFCS